MSTKTTELYLVRHGRTDWNALGLLQGKIERELDEEGRRQAQKVAEEFADIPFSTIYSSTMVRARQTAEIIALTRGCVVTPIEGLHERSYGTCEGMDHTVYEQKFMKEIAKGKSLPLEEYLRHQIAEGYETAQEVIDRALPRLKEIEQKHRGEKVLIVCHGGIIRTLVIYLLKKPDLEFSIPNGGHIRLLSGKELFNVFYEEVLP